MNCAEPRAAKRRNPRAFPVPCRDPKECDCGSGECCNCGWKMTDHDESALSGRLDVL